MPGFIARGLLTGLCWGLLASASWACELISTAQLQQVIENPSELEQNSQLPQLCRYSWRKTDWETIEASNQQQLKELSRSNTGYQPVSIWARLEIEVYFEAENSAQAQTRFQEALTGQQPRQFGSPDPTAQARFKSLDSQQAWSAEQRQLLVHKGKRLYLLKIEIESDPDQDKALALKLATQLP